MQAHDQRSASDHVVRVGEGDEQYGGQVVDQHDHEILVLEKERRETKKRKGKCGEENFLGLCTASMFPKGRQLWLYINLSCLATKEWQFQQEGLNKYWKDGLRR